MTKGIYTAAADLIGKRFGKLLVIKREASKNNQAMWLAECDCGGMNVVSTARLNFGSVKSCGCLKYSGLGRTLDRSKWLPEGQAAFNALLDQYKRGAKSRGHSFDLNSEDFRAIVSSACHYCGSPPSRLAITKYKQISRHYNGNFTYNGIDRKINSIGYTLSNSVACCTTCNFAKHNMTYEQFIVYLDNLTAFRTKK